jgi:hypothetical protein
MEQRVKRTSRSGKGRRPGPAGRTSGRPAGKKYAIHWQGDEPVAYEVDGVRYKTLDDVPDPADQEKLMSLAVGIDDDDLDIPETPSIPLDRVLLTVFIGVAVLMLGIALYSATVVGRNLAREAETTGEVLDLIVRRDDSGAQYYYPIVQFALPDGTRRTVEMREGSWPPAYERFQQVTVRYDPAFVDGAYVKSFSNTLTLYTVTLVTGILAVAFLLATLLTVWITKKVPDVPSSTEEERAGSQA